MPEKNISERVAYHTEQLLIAHSWPTNDLAPAAVAFAATSMARAVLAEIEADVMQARAKLCVSPLLQFPKVFSISDLPDTPTHWHPVPVSRASAGAMASIALLNALLGFETLSYGSENDGELFVNLVAMPGTGAIAEKSVKGMRGHTDAASFPFPGSSDPDDSRISPSPDVVCLAGMRNDMEIPTHVIPLALVLDMLEARDIDALKSAKFAIHSQRSFRRGTRQVLGQEHSVVDAPVLIDGPTGPWIRYSHSNVSVPEGDESLVQVQRRFEKACQECQERIVLGAGDVVVINNRNALHGRSSLSEGVGPNSRWLLRGYGLRTDSLRMTQREVRRGHVLFP